jgi:DNA polymerase-4
VTARKLRAHGIAKLVDVRAADPGMLREAVGSLADWLRQLANGIDDRAVQPDHEPKSSGSENTFARDLLDMEEIREEIDGMARGAASWLTRHALFARTVTIKVRYHDFTTITRSHTAPPTREEDAIAGRAVALLARTDAGRRPVRLLGVSVHNLCESDVVPPRDPETTGPRLPFESHT